MLTLELLDGCGVNTREGVARCAGSTDFYIDLVRKVIWDTRFDALGILIESGDFMQAQKAVGALIETAGNLSLAPMVERLGKLAKLLEAKCPQREDINGCFSDLMECVGHARQVDEEA